MALPGAMAPMPMPPMLPVMPGMPGMPPFPMLPNPVSWLPLFFIEHVGGGVGFGEFGVQM